MRLFVAVDIDENLKPKILKLQEKFRLRGVKLVEPENLHFTLKFLGEQPEKNIYEIKHILEKISSMQSFEIKIAGVGAFPSEKFIRVLWLGSSGLELLMKKVQDSLSAVRKDEYEPQPHLTLARVSSHSNEIQNMLQSVKDVEIGTMKVNSFSLKSSSLTGKGPVYSDVKRIELKSQSFE